MNQKPKIAAIIPARMASTRFPNKPLFEIEGLPMIEHVRRRALMAQGFSDVVVATCDHAIQDCVESFGGRVLMTSDKHEVATERIIEAMGELDCTHVVNVQGDEVLILPHDLKKMIVAIHQNPAGEMWNAVAPLTNPENLGDKAIVKVVLDFHNQFLYCSRIFQESAAIYWVIGLLAYEKNFLNNFSHWRKTPREKAESIEQMRVLENRKYIHGVLLDKAYPGINEPREVEEVLQYLREDPLQRDVLKRITKECE